MSYFWYDYAGLSGLRIIGDWVPNTYVAVSDDAERIDVVQAGPMPAFTSFMLYGFGRPGRPVF